MELCLCACLVGQCVYMQPWSQGVLSLWLADEGHSVQGVLSLERHRRGTRARGSLST